MATSIDKRSIQLMIDRYQRELDGLFNEQEAIKATKLERKYAKGGKVKAAGGFEVPGAFELWQTLNYGNRTPVQPVDTAHLSNSTTNPYLQATVASNDRSLQGTSNPYTPGMQSNNWWGDVKDWGKENVNLNSIATMTPVLYNTFMGLQKPKQFNAKDFYNPYANQVASLMRNRRVNVQPQLDASLDAQRIANYNAGRVGAGGMGNIQGNFAAIANNAMRTRAGIMANKENMDLGYKGEEAQTMNARGLHESGVDFNIADYNERSKASRRNYLGTAAGQLSQLAQVNKQMSGQLERDQMLAKLYPDMFSVSRYMPSIEEINRLLANRG